MEEEDPFDFLLKISEISRPQEELLRASAFSGEPVNADQNASSCSSDIPPEANDRDALLMCSLPETQPDAEKFAAGGSGTQEQDDVFHTPPEKSSVPSSGDMPPSQPCKLIHEVDVPDDETLRFFDLDDSQGDGSVNSGRVSELGFSEVQLSQRVEGELLAQNPRGIKRDAVAEQFEGFERETCISESPVKKSKLLEPNSGLESSRDRLGVESQELEQDTGNCKVGADVEPEKVDLAEEQVSKDNKGSVPNNLCSCHGNEAYELGSGKEGQKTNNNLLFDLLKVLAENSADDNEDAENDDNDGENASLLLKVLAENSADDNEEAENDDNDGEDASLLLKVLAENSADDNEDAENDGENAPLLDVLNISGINFPRPRWWQDSDLFRME